MSDQKRGGHPKFYELGEEENNLYSAKHYQYATDDDPMSNFRRCGVLIGKLLKPGVDPTIAAALVLMSKQVVGVYEIVGEGKTGTVESLEDKLKDIGIYSRIIRILVSEKEEAEPAVEVKDGPYCEICSQLADCRLDRNNEEPRFFCDWCKKHRLEHRLSLLTSPMEKL